MRTLNFYLFSLMFLLFLGCKEEAEAPTLEIGTSSVSFSKESSEKEVAIKTNVSDWVLTIPPKTPWLSAVKNGNAVKISVTENTEREPRTAEIRVRAASLTGTIKISQLGDESSIIVSSEIFTLDKDGDKFEFEVTSNIDYELVIPSDADWLEKVSEVSVNETTTKYAFSVGWNKQEEVRRTELQLNGKNKGSNVKKVISVSQRGQSGYDGAGVEDVQGDIKLTVASGLDSSHQSDDSDISKSFDGNYDTLYHSKWDNSAPDYFPITLEYFFENETLLNYIIYHPRKTHNNGIFKEVEIWVKAGDDNSYVKKMDYSFAQANKATKIVFEQPVKNPKAVKFVVKEGYGDRKGFASCAEMEFYKYNVEAFDPSTIFADEICSELKPNITEDDIAGIPNAFYRNMAYYMKKGTYPREFRIQEYKAWDNPETMARKNKNTQYSEIDGVTGIYVDEGEKLIVFVGDTHGEDIGLMFVNLDKPGGDGYYGRQRASLHRGQNIITAPSKGLVYVMYNRDNYKNFKPIKIHFASGKVNGYFDSTKHDAADWDRILGAAKYKYFDVVGEKAHLLFEADDYRQHCGSAQGGISVINQFDKLVKEEQILMGMKKYDRIPGNRALFHVMYRSYMYSTSYRTAYNHTTVAAFLTPGRLETSPWGPAHELGHTHQVRPDVRWVGTTECTVNIPSLYIQTGWGNKSRIQRENRYQQWFTKFFVKNISHFDSDVWGNLVPFWQLKLYIENVEGYEDFYKDLYEKARKEQTPPGGARAHILNFPYLASSVSGYDLEYFFNSWGYYRVIDKEIDDYGKSRVTITEDHITEAKNKLRTITAGMKKPPYTMRYISDDNWQIFKNRGKVVKGTARVNGKHITLNNNWQNVIACEVYNADKELIFVSNLSDFELDTDYNSNMKVYAIQYDGEKIEVDF